MSSANRWPRGSRPARLRSIRAATRAPARSAPPPSSASTLAQSSQRSNASGATMTGMRSWMAASVRFARVVTIAAVSTSSPFGPGPGLPQPGKSDRSAGFRPHEIGALRCAGPPFIKAVGGNEAAPPPHGVAERRLVEHRFAARIDQQRESLRILHPSRKQIPSASARTSACRRQAARSESAGSAPRCNGAENSAVRRSRTAP